jgi:hypothetical protein
MSILDPKNTISNLCKKGFVKVDSHHHVLEFWYEEKMILHTRTSHNNQDINDYLISQMSKQCKLSKKQFMDLANCPLSHDEYVKILKQNGLIISSSAVLAGDKKEN